MTNQTARDAKCSNSYRPVFRLFPAMMNRARRRGTNTLYVKCNYVTWLTTIYVCAARGHCRCVCGNRRGRIWKCLLVWLNELTLFVPIICNYSFSFWHVERAGIENTIITTHRKTLTALRRTIYLIRPPGSLLCVYIILSKSVTFQRPNGKDTNIDWGYVLFQCFGQEKGFCLSGPILYVLIFILNKILSFSTNCAIKNQIHHQSNYVCVYNSINKAKIPADHFPAVFHY